MATAQDLNSLRILITGLRSGKGSVALSIFSLEQKSFFPGMAEKATKTFYLPLNGERSLTLEAQDLPPGEYAIALMHDENENKKMDTFFGIPQEGFGFSNNPKIYFGPPGFSKCSFQFKTGSLEIPIAVKYLF